MISCNVLIVSPILVIQGHGNPQKRQKMFGRCLFNVSLCTHKILLALRILITVGN